MFNPKIISLGAQAGSVPVFLTLTRCASEKQFLHTQGVEIRNSNSSARENETLFCFPANKNPPNTVIGVETKTFRVKFFVF